MIKMTDLHWAAGFLDGEGCFHLTKNGLNPHIHATQKDTWALEKLQKLFGGQIYSFKNRGLSDRTMFVWMLTSRRSIGLMLTLYSLVSPYRRGQIEHCVRRWKDVPFQRHMSPEKLQEKFNGQR